MRRKLHTIAHVPTSLRRDLGRVGKGIGEETLNGVQKFRRVSSPARNRT